MVHEKPCAARIPVATYRLQFNGEFTFTAAREVISYLYELGISDIYASSYVSAKEGSLHGYDIVDPTLLNAEIGTEEQYREMVAELRRFGMGQILDFVPNHMCIESTRNTWWKDVLENGPCSPYASFFDINWTPIKRELTNKVLLPFLGDQYGSVLERGELRLVFEEGAFFISYYESRFPVEPGTYAQILTYGLDKIEEMFPTDSAPRQELLSILTAIQHLPATTESNPDKIAERCREKEIVKKRLMQLCVDEPRISGFIGETVGIFNGVKGDSRSFDLLDRLLRDQVYRLSFWRVATEEINYRRFFDINGLSAIRMEDPAVFAATHALLFRLVREETVTGVRIDHVDGLYDPSSYLDRLQKSCYLQVCLGAQAGRDDNSPSDEELETLYSEEFDAARDLLPSYKPFYITCEKILLKGERLPEEWPVYGTTGYDFLNSLNGIFVDTENSKDFDKIYTRFVKASVNFPDIVYEKKRLVMQVALAGEVNTLGHYLNTISERDRLTRDFTRNSLTRAIWEVISFFPVYRTYVNSAGVREKDSQYIEAAIARAKRKNPSISTSVFDFIRSVLLLKFPPYAQDNDREEWLRFVMRFQQMTGPVMAKGLEDTAFYAYNRLVSLNEVGGMPDRFGTTLETFHGHNLERAKAFPHSLVATATHDSKRGEDVRARINALSEIPEAWQKNLVTWSRINKRKKVVIDGQVVPDRNEEYFLYQTLIGAWPVGPLDDASRAVFRDRIRAYMVKALREAKINSSWINPNTAYEEAVGAFVDSVVGDGRDSDFLRAFQPLERTIARYGLFNSLSQVILKIACPGVPDFYQGTELWELSLVDPDNRLPVDYRCRIEALRELKVREQQTGPSALIRELMADWETGWIKLYLIHRALCFRRENNTLFRHGDYVTLEASGERARNVCAFVRQSPGGRIVAVAPRFMAGLLPGPDSVPWGTEVWGDSFLTLPWPEPLSLRNALTGETVATGVVEGRTVLYLRDALLNAPVALLEVKG